MNEPDPLGPNRIEAAAARKEGARMGLPDLGDDERSDHGRQDPQAGLREAEPRPRFGDHQVRHGAQAHPAAQRNAMNPGNQRCRARVDRLEHLGHGHRVLLVRFGVEGHGRSHPGDVRPSA